MKNKKTEIDQRPKDRLTLPCNCGSFHYLLIDVFEADEYDGKELSFGMVDQPGTFWYRVRKAFGYVFGKKGHLYYMDVELTSKDAVKIIELLEKYIKL